MSTATHTEPLHPCGTSSTQRLRAATEEHEKQEDSYSLFYFKFPGRAEGIKLLFHVTGIPFQMISFDKETWLKLYKPQMPFGRVPCLVVTHSNQCMAPSTRHGHIMDCSQCVTIWNANNIIMYIAKKANMWQYSSLEEEAKAIGIILSGEDFMHLLSRMIHANYVTQMYRFMRFTAPNAMLSIFVGRFASQIQDNYFINSTMGMEDVTIYAIFKLLLQMGAEYERQSTVTKSLVRTLNSRIEARMRENEVFWNWFEGMDRDERVRGYYQTKEGNIRGRDAMPFATNEF